MESCKNTIGALESLRDSIRKRVDTIRGSGFWVEATRSIAIRVYEIMDNISSLIANTICLAENLGGCIKVGNETTCKPGCGALRVVATPNSCSIFRLSNMREIKYDAKTGEVIIATPTTSISIDRSTINGKLRTFSVTINYLDANDVKSKYQDALTILREAEHVVALMNATVENCIREKRLMCS